MAGPGAEDSGKQQVERVARVTMVADMLQQSEVIE